MTATVLVVDGDASSLAGWEALLSEQGCDVIAARTGETALSVCPQIQPDLVLLNDLLPDIRGLDVCRRLKSDPRNRLTPIVLMASANSVCEVSKAREAGADDFWGQRPTLWEAFNRVQCLLQVKTYVDEQAEAVIFSLARTVESRDPFDGGHCARVSSNAVRFGKSLNLNAGDLEALRIGGLVHDIGKIAVPEAILLKPGPLDPAESRIVAQHPIVGEQICAPLKSFRHVLPIIRHHHERMNGTGYPDGLHGSQIPMTVRIIQIVDICDALTSDRSYRKTLPLPQALVILYEEADRGWLDEALVSQYAALVIGSDGTISADGRRKLGGNEEWGGTALNGFLNSRGA